MARQDIQVRVRRVAEQALAEQHYVRRSTCYSAGEACLLARPRPRRTVVCRDRCAEDSTPKHEGVVAVAGTTDRIAEGYEGGRWDTARVSTGLCPACGEHSSVGVCWPTVVSAVCPVGRGAIMAGRRPVADPAMRRQGWLVCGAGW